MRAQRRPHRMLVTIGLEDYFHVGAFSRLVGEGHWERFEPRIEASTRRTLDLLDLHDVRATFFVMGWVADRLPDLVREVAERGHEIANQGYQHRTIQQLGSRAAFRDDLLRSHDSLERASGQRVIGYRVPHFLTPDTLWALDVLAEEGYLYDSSIRPALRTFERRRHIHRHRIDGPWLTEVPVSTTSIADLALPLAAGNALRQLPRQIPRSAVSSWFTRHPEQPFVTYFHVWELDPGQPRLNAPWMQEIRQYRNLDKMDEILAWYFERYDCVGVADHLKLTLEPALARSEPTVAAADDVIELDTPRTPVSVVIPCYNESKSVAYLSNTLAHVRRELGKRYDLHFVFVDDGSSDDTADQLEQIFGARPGHTVVRHPRNRGVGAAIMTGIRAAGTEVVCSMDCDCTYDPMELGRMIPLLDSDVAMVTASPYHPEGEVVNVPGWRLFLSRGASALYRQVLQASLHTYTSCFRVYRRSAVCDMELEESGFLGVAEMLGRLSLSGARVIEHPATLEVRIFGQSKMKTFQTILGHLTLLRRLWQQRLAAA